MSLNSLGVVKEKEETSSLANASLSKLALTGILFGIIHVLTGPDHLSAIATMSVGSSWRSFILGVRWGCGHSIGLVIIAIVFISLHGHLNLSKFSVYTDALVGVFMIALGVHGVRSGFNKFRKACEDHPHVKISDNHDDIFSADIEMAPINVSSVKSPATDLSLDNCRSNSTTEKPPPMSEHHALSSSYSPTMRRRQSSDSSGEYASVLCSFPGGSRSPSPAHGLPDQLLSRTKPKDLLENETTLSQDDLDVSLSSRRLQVSADEVFLIGGSKSKDAETTVPRPSVIRRCCTKKLDFENPRMQKIIALSVGIVHGIAGPGGILGVLPAVGLNDWIKSFTYLGSFCITSIAIMGLFAAMYGEVTGRLSSRSNVIAFRLSVVSSAFSIGVGILWLVLLSVGKLQDVLGEVE